MDYREKALANREPVCDICGFKPEEESEIEVHHPDGDRGNNDRTNLVPVCTECHDQIHGDGIAGYTEQLTDAKQVPLSAETIDAFRRYKGTTLSVDYRPAVREAVQEALDAKYQRVRLSNSEVRELLREGFLTTKTSSGEEALIEIE